MNKRRRTSSIASRGQDEDFTEDSTEAASTSGPSCRKRKKLDPTELCQQLYDAIRNHKKDDGALLCHAFIRVPKRRQEPSYYEVVTNPIDLLKVQQKLKTDEYDDMDDLEGDIGLIVSNAKAFYKRNTTEYKDACDLWDLFVSTKTKILESGFDSDHKEKLVLKVGKISKRASASESRKLDDEDTSESSTNQDDDFNMFEDLFTAVMVATDAENRPLHTEFQLLPSKRKYPRYYEVIDNPIDLKIIATKIQNNEYGSLADLEKDLLLMTKNAVTFNEPGSQIYKDAKALKKIIQSKKVEIEHMRSTMNKSSERIRNKRLRGVQSLSAVTAALEEESDSEDEAMDEEGEIVDADNPQWQLFEAVKSVTSTGGITISEPFWKLPSRRYYPDYYKEIKNPVSLSQIGAKIKHGGYGTLSEVAGDMNIMFENAKKYNIPTSKLYKDAVRLQKVMQTKVQELLDIDQVTKNRVTNKPHKETDSDADSEDSRRKRGPKPKNSLNSMNNSARAKKDALPLKKRLHSLCKFLIDYTCEDGRQPMLVFLEKPSKKLYPDYYQVISDPIDVLTIESKIKNDLYNTEDEMVSDFKLMFNNCRTYNEPNSLIFEDANIMERLLMEKVGGPMPTPEKDRRRIVKQRKVRNAHELKLRTLYDAIRDYKEPKGNRQLSVIFMKLPSKADYPDYYEVIKNPIDMEKISHKLKNHGYESLDEIVADFILMFDNACKYNEPDSQIYKDALLLQRVCLQTKQQLREDEDTVPDVTAAVQDILCSLFTSVYNHQDEEGRCFSDSMAELPEHDDIEGKKVRGLSLDLIKRRLDRGLYKRLDMFQEDFFACLERARRLSRTDSQVFEDAVELQSFFIKQRDELCRNGDLLSSPALNYSLIHLTASVEACKQSKAIQESLEDESDTRSSDDAAIKDPNVVAGGESMTCNQQTFRVNDFVYLDSKEKGVDPSIVCIERLWNNNGVQMLYGRFFLRPAETYHLTTRKFLEKEVFLSDTYLAVPLDQVKERCCVLNVRDYYRMMPEDYDEKDVFVCESRYTTKSRTFKKIKNWPYNEDLTLIDRETPLEMKRVISIFRERVEKHKDELAELEEQEKLIEKEKPNVVAFVDNIDSEEGNTYYEQYNTICSGVVKTGDCVYVATDGGRQIIAQIDTIWETKDGKCYFRGPWLVTPAEIVGSPSRTYYKQEVFLSTLEDTNPVVGIVGKCAVLDYSEYISSRPTEIPEADSYICVSVYDEVNRTISKLPPDGLKKYSHSNAVTEDEIYYFPKLINPVKVDSDLVQLQPDIIKTEAAPMIEVESSPAMTKLCDMDVLMEDSMDGGPPSVGSGDIPIPAGTSGSATPLSSKKRKGGTKLVTGYILYSSDVRKRVVQTNPDSSFGEISRLVGNEWRSLPAGEKQIWEEKAQKVNEELKNQESANADSCASPSGGQTNPQDQIFECCWDNCDWQFEEMTDCIDHCIQEGCGHVQTHFQNLKSSSDVEYHCHWRTCGRLKKNVPPFPSLARLVRHVRELHINKGNGRVIPPAERSKNFTPGRAMPTLQPAVPKEVESVPSAPAAAPPKPQEPLFIAVPPSPQRLLHSEAYIKYIEGLSSENKFISQWEKTLNANPDNTTAVDQEKLASVSTWLGNGTANHGSVVKALWALRDFMLRDTFNVYRNY